MCWQAILVAANMLLTRIILFHYAYCLLTIMNKAYKYTIGLDIDFLLSFVFVVLQLLS
jgi:hypothetical protein